MIVIIQDKQFDTKDITRLYPAAVIKTGHKNETTQASLEWLDMESKGKVEVVGYGIFVHLGEKKMESFIFETREEMDTEVGCIAAQVQKQKGRE
ncbi:MAG: phosphomannomutase [Sulfurovum sp.]|nr:phosphomannomutase [Sulfurovum sp.]MCB4744576.1 phosphomannomutase [Sulfurovum sp.]MCB4746862.1 phosphomannomutase [Sulfurovum sp.]MCB4747019.1 phosphomannomutase [Sulfurovum sp.]MCB4748545.1 phosphomannomutase [Sulfurovum sp.]